MNRMNKTKLVMAMIGMLGLGVAQAGNQTGMSGMSAWVA